MNSLRIAVWLAAALAWLLYCAAFGLSTLSTLAGLLGLGMLLGAVLPWWGRK